MDAKTKAPKLSVGGEFASHESMIAALTAIDALQRRVDDIESKLQAQVRRGNNLLHHANDMQDRLYEVGGKISELQKASGQTFDRMDFFLGCALVAGSRTEGWDELSGDEMATLAAEDAVAMNQASLELKGGS